METSNELTLRECARRAGLASARKLTPEQRRHRAQIAARARWAKKAGAPDPTPPPDPNRPPRDGQYAEAGILSTPERKPAVPVSVKSQPGALHAAA